MATRATGTFTIDTWEATPYDDQDGVSLSRTRVTKTFSGEIEGTSTAELLMAQAPEGSAAYVGMERIVGTLNGRAGSFVLHHSATADRGTQSAAWTVVPDSGTGELRGMRGQARIDNTPDGGHAFTLDYDLSECVCQRGEGPMTADVILREVADTDLPIFFEQQRDPDANHMAAFTARDPSDWIAFLAHQRTNLSDDTNTTRTILSQGQVVGSIACYQARPGEPEVTYWLGKEYWGKGIATAALRAFLGVVTERPIYGRTAKDNLGSLRVLQKCGFVIIGEDSGYANARSTEIEEYLLRLD